MISMVALAIGTGVLGLQRGAGVALVAPLMAYDQPPLFFAAWATGLFASMGGAVVSVGSQACAAAIIARSEGEYWVPGPPPDPDELQGLKSNLELAEG